MLRRFGNKWQRSIAVVATIIAILFSVLPLSPLNAAFTASHSIELAEIDRDQLEPRPAAPHFVKSPVQHRHGHSSADHSHDLPTGISSVGKAEPTTRAAWGFKLSSAVVTNLPASIDRPPKT
jgi:hypothetical protein